MKKRAIAFLLVLVLCVSLMPIVPALAEENAFDELTLSAGNDPMTGMIKLDWSIIAGARLYSVYRAETGSEQFELIMSTTALFYTDESAVPGTDYSYYVKAIGSESNQLAVSDTASATCKLPTLSNVTVDYTDAGNIVFYWDEVPGATGYRIERSESTEGPFIVVCQTKDTHFSDVSAEVGKYYYYKLFAVTTQNLNAESVPVAGPALPLYPKPVNLRYNENLFKKTVIKWDNVKGVDGFIILKGDSEDINTMEPLSAVAAISPSFSDDVEVGKYYCIIGVKILSEDEDPIPSVPVFVYIADKDGCQHKNYDKTTVAPTCTEPGYTTHICKDCGYSYNDSFVAPTGHNVSSVITVSSADIEGFTTCTCIDCGYVYCEITKSHSNHDFSSKPQFIWNGYNCEAIFTCKNCTETLIKSCSITNSAITTPTCTEKGLSSYTASVKNDGTTWADSISVDIPALGHDMGEWTQTKTPTCIEKGEEQRYCSRCDAFESRELAAVTSHHYGAPVFTWNGKNCTVTFSCEYGCGTTHSELCSAEAKITREATTMHTGTRVITATVTFEGVTYTDTKTEIIPMLDDDDTGSFFTQLLDSIRNIFRRIFSFLPFC